MVNVLLVGGASPFGVVLAKKLRAVGAKVFIFDTKHVELDDIEFILGSLENALLVRRVVNECQVSGCFSLSILQSQNKVHFRQKNCTNSFIFECDLKIKFQITRLFFLPTSDGETNPGVVARQLFLNLTALIEEVRHNHSSTSTLPQVVHVSQYVENDKNCLLYKTAALSAEAFLHSYAIR